MIDLKQAKNKLFPYAYNILGNSADCEDVIQDVLIRYNQKESGTILNPDAYLIKAVINQSINLKAKNDRLRKQNVSLPEPIITNYGENKIETEEILNYSMLVLLDTMNIKERAVFLLKEVFDFEHEEISEVLNITPENSRQLLSRAKKKLKTRKPDVKKPPSKNKEYLKKYVDAIRNGDVQILERMLSDEVQVMADGGTQLNIVAELTSGIGETIKLVTYIYEYYQRDFEIKIAEINHQMALLFYKKSKLINCQVFEFGEDGKITNIYSVVNPDKLLRI